MKRKYESMFILPPMEDEQINENIEKVKKFIAKKKGEILEVKDWGKRKLAYEINNHNEGYYVIITFEFEPNQISSLKNFYKLDENIIRSIVIKRDE
ncbi:MAG: 30S ribosomal protein S6 [Candidatus Cloacimonadota bacterium]|nr:30S ribosomal protein S6 [Candidatus Cloacimonadota bacterium]